MRSGDAGEEEIREKEEKFVGWNWPIGEDIADTDYVVRENRAADDLSFSAFSLQLFYVYKA